MVREVKLRQVGGSVGATLPKDMAARLNLGVGDRVLAVETENGIGRTCAMGRGALRETETSGFSLLLR